MGIPPSIRFRPPPVGRADSGVLSSFHSSTWCSKNTQSPSARLISATGTSSPSTWQVLLENLNSVMSRSRGASFQPESLTRLRASRGAPQVAHVACPGVVLGFAPLALDPLHAGGPYHPASARPVGAGEVCVRKGKGGPAPPLLAPAGRRPFEPRPSATRPAQARRPSAIRPAPPSTPAPPPSTPGPFGPAPSVQPNHPRRPRHLPPRALSARRHPSSPTPLLPVHRLLDRPGCENLLARPLMEYTSACRRTRSASVKARGSGSHKAERTVQELWEPSGRVPT